MSRASAAVGAFTYAVVALLGSETLGPIVVSAVLVAALSVALGRRLLAGRTLTAEG